MPETTTTGGLAVTDILEREAGGREHKATILCNLENEVYATITEWEYDTAPEAEELVRLCRDLDTCLKRLSLTADAALTLYRECGRCSSVGRTDGEDPCILCGGTGSIHADEADG